MSDSSLRASDPTGAPRVEREFVDVEGARWRVFERAFSDYDRRRGLSLIFASDAAVRRVRDYPPDWQSLTDEQLMSLSWKA
jgi:hypothetical protein